MRTRSGTTALVAGLLATTIGLATASAQTSDARPDSTHRFSLFGGFAGGTAFPSDAHELGASADFRWTPIPVPLRFSLSFNQRNESYLYSPVRGGQGSLDLVMRPIPKKFGIQPYFLGGLGMATRAPYSAIAGCYYALPCTSSYLYTVPRQTWAFAAGGLGLDVGRLFMQIKLEQPVASQGPTVTPVSLGFRFWD